MNSEINPQTEFPALPVRRRETLEIFDTALKIYRRYFWVLIGWSALIAALSLVPILNWFSFFAMPLLYGAVSCCVAAAVRGQKVRFSQCWSFTKPRYGALLGVVFLSYLVLFGIFLALYIASILLGLLGYWALSSAPQPVQIVAAIVGGLLALVAFSAAGVVAFGWTNMVPIVACLEDDKRGSAALGRAFELLKGQWRRVFGMSLILGLAILAVFGIIGGIYSLVIGFASLRDALGSDPGNGAIYGLLGTFGAFMGLFILIWNPAQSLVIAVLYLDLRVRREALDLEWTAYASAPSPMSSPGPTISSNSFSASAPAEFDFLRPDAVSISAPAMITDARVQVTPVQPAPQAVENLTSPTSFAAGSAFAPENALAARLVSRDVNEPQKMEGPASFLVDAVPDVSSEPEKPEKEAQRD
ncbi:hypothetical protein B1R32_109110 [Abditibacterium utsteinense]|uniref:Membrane domain of glycerophosphoryl diester phosphodiesterase n=1 Tax=Abditibacterium utsteinense TaxID=1960156 RepID=A0A2S8SSI9_9BACT|nr:hypothetical protein [Abditibacterium utsteinense]PQV63770.1 hypothetical protein B1R32_109110 [Abditibacterium utsteinense]